MRISGIYIQQHRIHFTLNIAEERKNGEKEREEKSYANSSQLSFIHSCKKKITENYHVRTVHNYIEHMKNANVIININ